MGVDLRGGQLAVPKHLLDEPNIGSAFEHQRRHTVPEQMAGSFDMGIGFADVCFGQQAEVIGSKCSAGPGDKDGAVIDRRQEPRPNFPKIAIGPILRHQLSAPTPPYRRTFHPKR